MRIGNLSFRMMVDVSTKVYFLITAIVDTVVRYILKQIKVMPKEGWNLSFHWLLQLALLKMLLQVYS
jgi:hypothetical protein